MRPPICAVCKQPANNNLNSGLVRFQLSEADKAFNKKFEEPGFAGHPKGVEWFCSMHYYMAKKYTHLHKTEALQKIDDDIHGR